MSERQVALWDPVSVNDRLVQVQDSRSRCVSQMGLRVATGTLQSTAGACDICLFILKWTDVHDSSNNYRISSLQNANVRSINDNNNMIFMVLS